MRIFTFNDIVLKYSNINSYDIQVNISYIFDIAQSQVKFKTYSQQDMKLIDEVFAELNKGIPLQYTLNKAYFYARTFYVNNNVLIPRFDTEILVENAIKYIKSKNLQSCLDLCCGSGAIGITINLETGIDVTCSDISEQALNVTKKNTQNLGASIQTVQSDLFNNLNMQNQGKSMFFTTCLFLCEK